jgi:hypothetical protein
MEKPIEYYFKLIMIRECVNLFTEIFKEKDRLKHVTHKEKFIFKFQVFRVVNVKVTVFFSLAPSILSGRRNV